MTDIEKFIPIGMENAISAEDLAVNIGISERMVRRLVSDARINGALICSSCAAESKGYFRPLTKDEIKPYYEQQLARFASSFLALKTIYDYLKNDIDD